MAVWVIRAGRDAKFDQIALDDRATVLGWQQVGDLSSVSTPDKLQDVVEGAYPDAKPGTLVSHRSQLWRFLGEIARGDLVLMPRADGHSVALGEVAGNYEYDAEAPVGTQHRRSVVWLDEEVERSALAPDLLKPLSFRGTIGLVKAPDADRRLRNIAETGGMDPGFAGADETRFWLFQADPQIWDLKDAVGEASIGDEDDWSVTRYSDEMTPGDGVILWAAGRSSGMYALGELSSLPFERPAAGFTPTDTGSAAELAVKFRYTSIPRSLVLKDTVASDSSLQGLHVLRVPRGTNFRVTPDEWHAASRLVEQRTGPFVWWVNQGESNQREKAEGILRAGTTVGGGRRVVHHDNMMRLRSNDVVLHHWDAALRSASHVVAEAVERPGGRHGSRGIRRARRPTRSKRPDRDVRATKGPAYSDSWSLRSKRCG